ncbi:hypothetical protein BDA99DRAFT_227036 [Phascolomyces articulosus]|uniref:Uncharacterized protein n=1 Tax=Phascolomyces articulosus TaxID=60185 RepID=A0AAD5JZB1_9FUNG|nr:hypothetical protein BDA99DRAFT_227036 [Phascolomyces articulosus]
MAAPFILPRLSGSTLEPTVDPVVMYPPHIHQKEPLAFDKSAHLKTAVIRLPTGSLQRKGKPTFIHIPAQCKEFIPKESSQMDNFSPWSYDEEEVDSEPELLWDEETQTIYKSSSKRRANSYSYSSSSVSSDGSPFFPPA